MGYSNKLSAISRIPVVYVKMTMDYCSLTFGVGACTATASVKCHNTYPTCRDKTNFARSTKEYKFTSADAPLPFETGERPYVKKVKYMPTEITDSLTVNSRIIIDLFDEPDTDVGIDPYLSDRVSIQGTFWKKFLARNTNYKGRIVQMYDGFLDMADIRISEDEMIRTSEAGNTRIIEKDAEEYFEEKFIGVIDNIKISKDVVKIEVVDLLKSISKIEIPPKLDIRLANDITDSQAQMTLEGDDISSLDDPGYVRIDDEIIYYDAINTTTKIISTCTRGHFSTTATKHSEKDKVQKTRYFAPGNGFDHMKTILLTDCEIAAGYVDNTEFDTQRDDAAGDVEIDFSAIISEPVKAEDLYFELVDLLNCKSWVAEDLKITIKRNLPNRPDRSYTVLTDEANIIFDSANVDLNQKSRRSRVSLHWDRSTIGDNDEIADFARLDLAVDKDAEGVNEYNEIAEKEIFCRWLRSGYDTEENMNTFAKNHPSRLVGQFRDPMPIIDLKLELKDSGIKTGDYIKLTTDELQDKNGDDLTLSPFQVVRREKKDYRINLKCLRITPKKYMIIAPTDVEKTDIFYPVAGGDDGIAWDAVGFSLTTDYLTVETVTVDRKFFIRFPSVNIPQGATIISSFVKLTCHTTNGTTVANADIALNTIDTAVAPTDRTELEALSLTGNVAWNNIPIWVDGTQYNTPSLNTILQSIVDRGGWSSGNAVLVVFDNRDCDAIAVRYSSSIEYLSGNEKAELHITWVEKDYDSATAAEREYGAICDINGLMVNGDDGYRIW